MKITQDPTSTNIKLCYYGPQGNAHFEDKTTGVDGIKINFNMVDKATVDVYSTMADEVK